MSRSETLAERTYKIKYNHGTTDTAPMIEFKSFTGGIFATTGYLLKTPAGNLLIDAPQGADEAFADDGVQLLALTHGHYDHVVDAAAIQRRHGCPIAFHADTAPLVADRDAFKRFGFNLEIEPFGADFLLDESPHRELLGLDFSILHVPGHCPGSICFYHEPSGSLFGGDVLFNGGIGRWDLPGGDLDLLLSGIRSKILTLPDAVKVYPGHGPSTTVGHERSGNPFLE